MVVERVQELRLAAAYLQVSEIAGKNPDPVQAGGVQIGIRLGTSMPLWWIIISTPSKISPAGTHDERWAYSSIRFKPAGTSESVSSHGRIR